MPASSSENLAEIEETVKSSLSAEEVDSEIQSSSKQVLLHKIDFKPAEKPYSLQVNSLRAKYIPLNKSEPVNKDLNGQNDKTEDSRMNGEDEDDDLPPPKLILYPEDKIVLEWKKIHKIGAGLVNMGNTCFLNSTLQCLTYTAPLVNYCLSNEHDTTCKQVGFCMICQLQRHVKRCYENSGNAIKPQTVLHGIRYIAKHMLWGRQEDAHEFLRYVVDAMQKSCLVGHAKLDKFSKETTVVSRIFGGFLRSQVQCLKCKEKSNTYDPFLDMSLEIKNIPTLEKAFERYVYPETLDNDNAYMCTKCKQKVPAHKRFSIHKPPNILTISLKRFDYNRMVGKVTRGIQFSEKLDIRPYMSNKQGEKVLYKLYAVLVHSGPTCTSGHYYCYVKSPSQVWYCMNDSMVYQVSASQVLASEAYLLFYSRFKPSTSKKVAPVIGPTMPNNHKKFKANGVISGPSNDTGSFVARKPSSSVSGPGVRTKKSPDKTANATPLPDKHQREKVAFGIKPQPTKSPQKMTPGEDKPRIVMHIKNGKVTTFEKSPNGKSKIVKDSEKGKSKLVPYCDDSESDTEIVAGPSKPSSPPKQEEKKKSKALFVSNKKIKRHCDDSAVVFDKKLNATTSVPGNNNLLDMKNMLHSDSKSRRRLESLNLMVSRSKEMDLPFQDKSSTSIPAKKVLSDSSISCLTTVVPPSGVKLNSTTTWQVFNQDCAPSPSVGSSSSRDSVNSTTEWHVLDRKEIPQYPKVPERQFPGWKVSENEKTLTTEAKDAKASPPKQESDTSVKVETKSSVSIQTTKETMETPNAEESKHTLKSVSASPVKTDVSVDNVCVENSLGENNVDVSDKQGLLSQESCKDSTDRYLHKKHKKHKKHKRSRDDIKYKELVNESDGPSPTKKPKKKKHKRKHDSDQESAQEHKERRGTKHLHEDGEELTHKKLKSDSGEDSPEFEWVEKTKDSLTIKPETGAVQNWDHHVKDGYKRHKSTHDNKVTQMWDGSKTSKVAEQLEKYSSRGYGENVSSWNGECSSLDKELNKEREKDRKRSWTDAYDEEYDRGKVKKVKQHHSDQDHQHNYFQHVQDDRNKEKHRLKNGSYNSSSCYSYHSNGYFGTNGSSHHGNQSSGGPRHHGHHTDHYHRDRDSYRSYHHHGQSSKHYRH